MKKILLSLLCVTTLSSFAQVQMNTTGNFNDPSYLIDNVLIGNGVITSNHSYIGDSSQIGYFTDSLGLIGMSEGFVLSTGGVDSIGNIGGDTLWWDYIWDSTFTIIIDSTPFVENYFLSTGFMGNGDPDLLTIANSVPGLIGQTFTVSSTGDAAILEFDFIPSADTVKFNYVFASDEYLTFVNTSFNDVFAFLISGPGITGPYAAPIAFPGGAMNIAVIPNSNPVLPITISTVNDALNSQYYNHDTLGTASAFNGYTDVFTASAVVIPCNVYHIKLAIADGTDNSYDSGVFFEAGSFDATEPGALNVNAITTDILCYGDTSGTVQLCISGGVAPYTTNWYGINPNYLGTGTYNVDVIDAQGSSGGTSFTISGPSQIIVSATQNGNQLESTVIGGNPGYLYNWTLNGISINTSAFFTPAQNGNYILTVTDANGCIVSSDPVSVTNIPTGVNDILTEKLIVYPNPFNTKTVVNLLDNSKVINISLFDPQGRKVKDFTYRVTSDKIEIEKGNLQNGIYLIIIETNNYVSKSKLIIE
jgi:hypothetical protein